jgi:glycosyltransferase involved in cell wall biosynthesis
METQSSFTPLDLYHKERFRFPRITIITSTFNCAVALRKTAQSIRNQNYKNTQWIIVDAASTDNTVEVIKENLDIVNDWISEPDDSIYDAWNKASQFIDGEWVLFLGAGDVIADRTVLDNIARRACSLDNAIAVIYGNVLIQKPDGTPRYTDRKTQLNYWEFGRPALPHHQGVFHHRRLFTAQTPFDPSYRIAGDGKFLLLATKQGAFLHVDLTVAMMTDDGASNDYRNIFTTRREFRRMCRELGIKVPFLHKIASDIKWLLQYVGHKILSGKTTVYAQKLLDKLRNIFEPAGS